tara:strand:- start:11359 stop:11460 length:102 start_codon:yes stop_codon:yes gene_type:complete
MLADALIETLESKFGFCTVYDMYKPLLATGFSR